MKQNGSPFGLLIFIVILGTQLGGMAGLTALTMGLGQEQRANGQKAPELAS